jgi:hypothetical protein
MQIIDQTMDEVNTSSGKVVRDYCVSDGVLRHEDVSRLRPSSLAEPLYLLRERYNSNGYIFIKGLLQQSTTHALLSNPAICSPSSCDCMNCPLKAQTCEAQELNVPELTSFVAALLSNDGAGSPAPREDGMSPIMSSPARAWLCLSYFHPQGGGPIFLSRPSNAPHSQRASPKDPTRMKPLQMARELDRRWLVATYEAGDVVLCQPDIVSNDILMSLCTIFDSSRSLRRRTIVTQRREQARA